MTSNNGRLVQLKQIHTSVHKKSPGANEIQDTLNILTQSLQKVQDILAKPSRYTERELNESLDSISHIFRTVKFSTVLLPLLVQLSDTEWHQELWKEAKVWNTNMPLKPQAFENMRQSAAQTKDASGRIIPSTLDRELALLGVYGITMQKIGEAFISLNNK